MLWQKIYNHKNERTWEFCLVENSHPWIYGETLKLSAHYLDVQVVEGLNDGDILANIIPNNNGKPIEISQYYSFTFVEPKEIDKNILNGFRGAIIGYPNMQFSVRLNTEPSENSSNSPFICDVIEIKGGQKSPHPAYGAGPFSINFYRFAPNGEVELIKKITDNKCQFTINGEELNGQILSQNPGSLLHPKDIMDFIQKCKSGYSGRPSHKWEEVLGNKKDDSTFSYLSFDIRKQFVFLTYEENLHQESGRIFNKDDEWLDSTDRYLWAIYRFQSSYHLLKFINQIAKIADIIQQDKQDYFGDIEYLQMFKFKGCVSKSEFETATGIHLFESIITTHSRF
ncbi:MAG: hypothetical protein IKU35_09535 [Bacteroidaceae bacterium]|nr:hypothetical protein [Bacteroidaceae bacterium]